MVLSMVAVPAALAGSAAAQESTLEVTDGPTPDTVTPGESFDLEYTITNTGDEAASGGIELDTPDGVSVDWNSDASGFFISPIAAGDSATKSPTISVGDDVADGTYTLTATGNLGGADSTAEVDFTVGSDDGGDDDPNDDPSDDPSEDVDADISFDNYDALTGTSIWQGQEIAVDVGVANEEVNLYERTDSDATSLRAELGSNDNGVVVFETEDRTAGDYFLSGAGDLPTRSEGENIDNTFGVNEQSLTAEFDSDSVTDAGQDAATDFEFDSNRRDYPVTIHTSGDLDTEEMTSIFVDNGPFTLAYTEEGDDGETDYDEIGISGVTDSDEYSISFVDIDTGEYEFTFTGTDSTAEATDSITVGEEDKDGDFSQGVYQTTAGDIAEFELELEDTDSAWIQIGDENADFVDVVYIEADDESQPVSFQVNTRTLGTNVDTDRVYDTGENVDAFDSSIHDEELRAGAFVDADGENLGDNGDFADYLEELEVIDDASDYDDRADAGKAQLTRPAQPTDYELIAATSGEDGVFVSDEGSSGAEEELDNAVLELREPNIGDITTHVAPSEAADDDDNLEEVLNTVTQRSEIAIDDRLIVQVEASGLYGAMVDQAGDFDILSDGTSGATVYDITQDGNLGEEGINFNIEGEDAVGNQDPTSVKLEDADEDEVFVLIDNAEGQFFVIVDSSNADAFANGEPEDGDTFTAELEYETDDDNQPRFARNDEGVITDAFEFTYQDVDDITGFPYLQADSDISSSTEFTWADAEVEFDNVNVDDQLEAANTEESEISGQTNVAPGSNAEISISSSDASSSFRSGQTVDIAEDSSISGTFDLSEQQVEDEFDTNFRVSGNDVDTVSSVVVEAGSLGGGADDSTYSSDSDDSDDSSDSDDSTDSSDSDDMDDSSDSDDSTDSSDSDDSTDSSDSDSTDDSTPGFGAIVALVAVLGAALLATRRQN